jgi:hypothetical protein
LHGDNNNEVYCGLLYDGANQGRKLEHVLVTVNVPDDGGERRDFYTCIPYEQHHTMTVSSYVPNAVPIETEIRLSFESSAKTS